MKKLVRLLAVVLCLSLFFIMAIGSTSDSDEDKDIVSDSDGEDKVDITIEEQVLIDEKGIKITATEYVKDSIWGEGIKMTIENNTKKDVMVSCRGLIVNNYMITDLFANTVAAGKKANETMYLSSSALNAAGIDMVGQVEMYFHVYNSESITDVVIDEKYALIKTSGFDKMDTTVDDAGTELYNKNGLRIVGKAVDEDSFWGTAILLYCENKTGKKVTIQVNDMSINGYMIEPIFSCDIYDKKMAIDDIKIMESDLEKNDIETIDEVELKFKVIDFENYENSFETDIIKFSAK